MKTGFPLLLLALAASAALAQPFGQESVVQGSGSATLKKTPDRMRVQIELVAEGKTLKEALDKLKERQEVVRTFFSGLGAGKDDCEFEQPKVASGRGDSQAQMDMLIRARMMAGGRAAKPGGKDKKEAPKSAVSAGCKAELALKGASPEERLIAAQALQEKIKAANLSGHKDLPKPTPQEAEAAEEAKEEMMAMMGERGMPTPGEPVFLFVAKVGDDELEKAEKEAFAKAKKEAERLARVAGHSLGGLHRLSSSSSQVAEPDDPYGYASYPMRRFAPVAAVLSGEREDGKTLEAVGGDPTQVVFKVQVSAGFLLK